MLWGEVGEGMTEQELIARLLDEETDLADCAVDHIEQTQAKLTKAVEALEDLVRDCEADYPPSHGAIKHFAIATLAEIKGGNDAESNL